MASSGSERVPRHVHLRTHQRRLRHVVRVMLRNFSPPMRDKFEVEQLQLQVSLHPVGQVKDIYRSEVITGTRNPHWSPIKFRTRSNDLIPNSFDVSVWYSVSADDVPFQLAWKETVCLPNMYYVGLLVHQEGKAYPPNTLFLHTVDGLYCGENVRKLAGGDGGEDVSTIRVAKPLDPTVIVEEVLVRPCCDSLLLKRLLDNDQRYATSQDHCLQAKANLSLLWRNKQQLLKLQHERELLQARCAKHRQQVEEEELGLAEDTRDLQEARKEISSHNQGLSGAVASYGSDVSRLRAYVECVNTQFAVVRRNCSNRKKIMIEDLSDIFRVEMSTSDPPVPLICGIPLTTTEELQKAKSVDKAPVSLGYLAHVVHLLSLVLEKPLRFPLVAFGSQSVVMDDVLLEEGGIEAREFSFSYRKDLKHIFFHAMLLLRHDLSQLRYYCNITSQKGAQQKNMLLLLKELFDKVGARPGSEKLGRPKSSSVTSSNSAKGNSIAAEGGRGEDATPEDTPPSHQEQLLEGYLRETPNELAVQGEPPRVTFAIEAGSSPESYNFEQNGCERQLASAERQSPCERNEEAER